MAAPGGVSRPRLRPRNRRATPNGTLSGRRRAIAERSCTHDAPRAWSRGRLAPGRCLYGMEVDGGPHRSTAWRGGITDVAGCDGPPFGHVTVQYQIPQELFFAGVLGFDGPATVRTKATAGWGPTGSAYPIPIVVYTGTVQGGCRIEENLPPDQPCYLWYDNNPEVFGGSAFGFLNLCSEGDPCSKVGWNVDGGARCPNVGTSELRPWIDGTWISDGNDVNYPGATYVCRLSGLASNLWSRNLEDRVGDDLTFPVNDCATQVDKNGGTVGCGETPDKYNIIGFIVLRLDAVLDEKSEWGGKASSCRPSDPFNMKVDSPNIDLDLLAPGLGCTPYDTIDNVKLTAPGNPKCCTEDTHFLYDPDTHVVDWIGAVRDNVRISWDYAEGGPCGVPPNNSSAVCLQVTTVEVRFGGSTVCEECLDFGIRAVRLCDLAIGSCPRDN
jgi:hypothetical protein